MDDDHYSSNNTSTGKRRYFSRKLKNKIVSKILDEGTFVEEIMDEYQINSKDIIIKWIKEYLKNKEKE